MRRRYPTGGSGTTCWRRRGCRCRLVNARDVKNVPGRPKSDKLDAVWLAKLTEKGLLRPSFVPPTEIRRLRDYTRLRVDLTRDRARYRQRLEKLLEDALIKISSVASTLDTLSARDMIEALIAGERDPRRLAELARGRMKAKHWELITALDGRFDDHHGELARMLLGQIDALTTQIDTLSARIEALIAALPDHASLHRSPRQRRWARRRRGCGQRCRSRSHSQHRRRKYGPGRSHHRGRLRPGHRRAARRDPRHRRAQRAGHPGRDRSGHVPLPHPRALGVVGQAVPAHHPVRAGHPAGKTGKGNPYLKGALGEAAAAPPKPTPSSANATGASSNAAASSKPSSRSRAPSWSSSGTCWPTRPPASATLAPTTTPTESPPNDDCATTSPNSAPWATGSPSNPPPSPKYTAPQRHPAPRAPPGRCRLPTHPGHFPVS